MSTSRADRRVVCMQALCAVLEYELSPSGEDKLDVMTTLHRTNVGKQRQAEVSDRLRTLKLVVCIIASGTHLVGLHTIYVFVNTGLQK